MVDAVGSVTKIVEVALKIKDAVDTVRENKEVCIQIKKRVSRLSAILLQLDMEKMKEPVMTDTLLELQGTLLRALGLVTSCQEKSRRIATRHVTAGKLSKQLHQIKQDISDQMMEVILATNIQVSVMLTRHYQDGVHAETPSYRHIGFSRGGSRVSTVPTPRGRSIPQPSSCRSEVNGDKVSAPPSGRTSNGAPYSFSEYEATPYCLSESKTTPNYPLKSESTPSYSLESEATYFPKKKSEATSNRGCSAPERRTTDPLLSCFTSFRFPDLEVATNNFSKQNVIGKGGCATVYKGVLPDGFMVAIKRFRYPWGPQSVRQYAGIFSVLLQHENVVRFLGYCHEDRREMVVEEYMPKGNLSGIINGSSQKLDWTSTFRIIRGIAQGVAYLHTKNIIHMDLKPDNILFDSDMNPKICDFGSSVKLGQAVTETVTDELVGTKGYIPPEYLADGIVSVKNDVYSFGVLLLCTISGISTSGLGQDSNDISVMTRPRSRHDSINWAWGVREAGGMNKLFHHSLCNESLLERERCMEIGLLCTQVNWIDRPTMPDVLWMLDGQVKLPTPKRNEVLLPIESRQSAAREFVRALVPWLPVVILAAFFIARFYIVLRG